MSRPRLNAGFTLIELMIVVAIIAIIAAIAIPQYQAYVVRSQITAALAEISPGKTAYEDLAIEGTAIGNTYVNVDNLGLQTETSLCSVSLNVVVTGPGSITCQIKGNVAVQGKTIELDRNSSGQWSCSSTADPQYLPSGCTSG